MRPGEFLDRGDRGVLSRVDGPQGHALSVVHEERSSRGQQLQGAVIVVHVVARIRVDENQVERAGHVTQRLESRPHEHLDLLPVRASPQSFAGQDGHTGVDLAGQDRAVLRQGFRHRQRAGAVTRADLQHAAGTDFLHHRLEKRWILHSTNVIRHSNGAMDETGETSGTRIRASPFRRASTQPVPRFTHQVLRFTFYGSTITSTYAGKLSAPFLSVTFSRNRNSLGSETDGATNEALGMLRSRSGTLLPRTWLQV